MSLAALLSLVFSDSCMPKCKETLLQEKQRLTREQRNRTEKRVRELRDFEESDSDSDSEEDQDLRFSVTYSTRLVSQSAVPTSHYCVTELLGSQHLSEELSPIFKVKKSYLTHA